MKTILSIVGALAIIAAVAAGVLFFGGFYDVAASESDPGFVTWALQHVRDASINRHAPDMRSSPIALDDEATIQAGARAFASRGCTRCHGGPGVPWEKFSEGLNPEAPDLKEVVRDLNAAQIYWIVSNGINMTGMPSFAKAGASDDEIWKIAAFVKKLPDVKEDDYKTWTANQTAPADTAAPK